MVKCELDNGLGVGRDSDLKQLTVKTFLVGAHIDGWQWLSSPSAATCANDEEKIMIKVV